MVLEVMRANVGNIKQGCLLFPTIEHMITSPAGQRLKHLLKSIPTMILVFLTWLVSLLPRSILAGFVRFWLTLTKTANVTDACLSATLDLINPTVIANVLFLANTELQTVLDLDYELIKTLQDRIWFYYGSSDQWVPTDYYQRLLSKVPKAKAELCKREIPHAFVLSDSDLMAEIVASRCIE